MGINYMKNSQAFTLIELIIVIIVIAILAAIAVPLMQGIKNKAIISEGVLCMKSVRSAMLHYYAEYQKYPTLMGCLKNGGIMDPIDQAALESVRINPDDFEGTYFPARSFLIASTSSSFAVYCYISNGNGASEVYYVDNPDTKNLSNHQMPYHRIRMLSSGRIIYEGLSGV